MLTLCWHLFYIVKGVEFCFESRLGIVKFQQIFTVWETDFATKIKLNQQIQLTACSSLIDSNMIHLGFQTKEIEWLLTLAWFLQLMNPILITNHIFLQPVLSASMSKYRVECFWKDLLIHHHRSLTSFWLELLGMCWLLSEFQYFQRYCFNHCLSRWLLYDQLTQLFHESFHLLSRITHPLEVVRLKSGIVSYRVNVW